MLRRLALLVVTTLAVVTGLPGPVRAAATAAHYTGTLPDGGTWVADVPANWLGTLVLYSHGFGTLTAADAPNDAAREALLDRGYALVGSSYDPNGSLWALASAAGDQFAALAAIERIIGAPQLTLALGTSMGGLVSAQEAESAQGRLDGVLSTCGLVGGGVDLGNYQLDGEYALARLLAPALDIKLVGYASPADGLVAAGTLLSVAALAQATPAGRARVALGTALLNMPTWSLEQDTPPGPRDAAGLAAAQYDWFTNALPFVMPARYFIEQSAGGNASWNEGVDYHALLARSPYRYQVTALYEQAGLDLAADLADLTRHADVTADAPAVAALTATSTVTGRLDVPTLDLHTVYDQLAPVEFENRYARQVAAAGNRRLLRQGYVARRGHCAFTTSELIAGLETVANRISTGHWAASSAELQAAALATGLGDGPAFADFRPGPLVSHRDYRP